VCTAARSSTVCVQQQGAVLCVYSSKEQYCVCTATRNSTAYMQQQGVVLCVYSNQEQYCVCTAARSSTVCAQQQGAVLCVCTSTATKNSTVCMQPEHYCVYAAARSSTVCVYSTTRVGALDCSSHLPMHLCVACVRMLHHLYHSAWAFERPTVYRQAHSVQTPCTLSGAFEARVPPCTLRYMSVAGQLWCPFQNCEHIIDN